MSTSTSGAGSDERRAAAALAVLQRLAPALQRDDRAGQNRCVQDLVELDAPMGEQWLALGRMVAANGEIDLVRSATQRFVAQQGNHPLARYGAATVLEQAGAFADAYAIMRSLPSGVPSPAGHAFSLGTAALFAGEGEKARAELQRATALDPQSGAAWLSLAMATDLAADADIADRILSAEGSVARAAPQHQAPYRYAQGKVMAERGEYAAAFAAFARGAELMHAANPYDERQDRAHAAQSLEGFDRATIERIAAQQTEETARGIFVTGLPRSGTTLVEQILASHSAVCGGGEIDRLPILAREMRGATPAAIEPYLEREGAGSIARLWNHVLEQRFPGGGRVVDKTLATTRLIGMVAALLPEAPLVWVTRDPLDRAWSCFRTFFRVGLPWSYDLVAIARHFRIEDELLARWRDILGDRLLVVRYEDLVTEPQWAIRELLTHCGLAEELAVFTPHLAERTVTTASVMQVRRPIGRDAIGSAAPYREFLEPFVDAYAAG